jgi:hypothetical protein
MYFLIQLQNHKTDGYKQAQSVYIKDYSGIYTTLKYEGTLAGWIIFLIVLFLRVLHNININSYILGTFTITFH